MTREPIFYRGMQQSAFSMKKSMHAHGRFATMGMGSRSGTIARRLVALQERKGPVSSRRGLALRFGGKGGKKGSCLVELLARHQVGELIETAGARGVTCGGGAGIPSVGSNVIERQAFPLLVQVSQVRFRGRQGVLCSKP